MESFARPISTRLVPLVAVESVDTHHPLGFSNVTLVRQKSSDVPLKNQTLSTSLFPFLPLVISQYSAIKSPALLFSKTGWSPLKPMDAFLHYLLHSNRRIPSLRFLVYNNVSIYNHYSVNPPVPIRSWYVPRREPNWSYFPPRIVYRFARCIPAYSSLAQLLYKRNHARG